MITEKDKLTIIEAFNNVDVKKLQLDHPDQSKVKWFRFGSHVGIDIAKEIVKQLPTGKKKKVIKIKVVDKA